MQQRSFKTAFPNGRGDIFSGGLDSEQVARLAMDGSDVVYEEAMLRGVGRIRDIRGGPDGYIYVAIEDQDRAPTRVVRLEPVGRS